MWPASLAYGHTGSASVSLTSMVQFQLSNARALLRPSRALSLSVEYGLPLLTASNMATGWEGRPRALASRFYGSTLGDPPRGEVRKADERADAPFHGEATAGPGSLECEIAHPCSS